MVRDVISLDEEEKCSHRNIAPSHVLSIQAFNPEPNPTGAYGPAVSQVELPVDRLNT